MELEVEGSEQPTGTTPEVVTEVEGSESEQSERLLNLDEYGDYLVPVKVGGEETALPLAQVRDGLMMQADYTRKTQELSRQAQEHAEAIAIAKALDADPVGTLKVLQEVFANETPAEDEVEELDPIEREIKELREWRDAQEATAAEAALQAELDKFHEQYGVDQGELLKFAVDNGIPSLDWAFAVMQQGRSEAERVQQQQREQAEAARMAAKQQASVVEGGADRASGGSAPPTGDRGSVRSVADAARLAASQLGITL